MLGYREYGEKLAALGSMRRVTETMKMVAAARLHRTQGEWRRFKPYEQRIATLVGTLPLAPFAHHPLMDDTRRQGPLLLLVISSNRGLCGAFNAGLVRRVRRWLTQDRPEPVHALCVGSKGYSLLRHDVDAQRVELLTREHPVAADATRLVSQLLPRYLQNRCAEIHLAYNHYLSPTLQQPSLVPLLPLPPPPAAPAMATGNRQRLEPDPRLAFECVARLWLETRILAALLESAAGEHAARVLAMENASSNLRRMEAGLLLDRNRARQAAITRELGEIVGGAEALAG
jgi:F-type H+-transporting ATPase subunit gamma